MGIWIGTGLPRRPLLHLAVDLEEVRADAVHLVHEGEPRHLVLVRLAPHGLRLRLHAAHGVVHHAGAVQHAHGALHLDGEVHVAGGVDDVDAMLGEVAFHPLPEAGGRGEVMVMPRSRSCSIQSITVAPSWTSPILWDTPV
jgi:hypothetical protein